MPFTLAARDVHLWSAALDVPAASADAFEASLSADDRARADRFATAALRRRFLVVRGTLRALLGRYLRSDPRSVVLAYGSHGKPALAAPDPVPLHFNVSHRGDLALYAFTRIGPIGVDIERLVTLADGVAMAAWMLSPGEVELLRAQPPEAYSHALLTSWTRKEAFVKATGAGVTAPLTALVALPPTEDVIHEVAPDGTSAPVPGWCVRTLHPATGYVAAIAVESAAWELHVRHWPSLADAPGVDDATPAR